LKPKTSSSETTTITGIVDHIVFRNPENGYTVCVLKDASGGHKQTARPVTVVGNCAAIWDGETMEAEGTWPPISRL
jgi:exodeoxyribonuclease V alpha subunit